MSAIIITRSKGPARVALAPPAMSVIEAVTLADLAIAGIQHHHLKDGGERDEDLWPDVERALAKLGFTFPHTRTATEALW